MGRSWSHDNPEAHNVLLELWNIQRCAGIQVVAMGTPMKDLQPREGLGKLSACFSENISHDAALTGQNLVPKICNS